jgi:hypothetical protein
MAREFALSTRHSFDVRILRVVDAAYVRGAGSLLLHSSHSCRANADARA